MENNEKRRRWVSYELSLLRWNKQESIIPTFLTETGAEETDGVVSLTEASMLLQLPKHPWDALEDPAEFFVPEEGAVEPMKKHTI